MLDSTSPLEVSDECMAVFRLCPKLMTLLPNASHSSASRCSDQQHARLAQYRLKPQSARLETTHLLGIVYFSSPLGQDRATKLALTQRQDLLRGTSTSVAYAAGAANLSGFE